MTYYQKVTLFGITVLALWIFWETRQSSKKFKKDEKRRSELEELRRRLKQPRIDKGRKAWPNAATAEIWQMIDADWRWSDRILREFFYHEQDSHNFVLINLSAEHLKKWRLDDYIQWKKGGSWQLGDGLDDLEVYLGLIDYDRLSERLQESWKEHFPDKEYRIE